MAHFCLFSDFKNNSPARCDTKNLDMQDRSSGSALTFLGPDGLLLHLHQFSLRVLVVAQVLLVAHEDDRHVWAEVLHLQ